MKIRKSELKELVQEVLDEAGVAKQDPKKMAKGGVVTICYV